VNARTGKSRRERIKRLTRRPFWNLTERRFRSNKMRPSGCLDGVGRRAKKKRGSKESSEGRERGYVGPPILLKAHEQLTEMDLRQKA